MKLISLIFFSGLLSTLETANALPNGDSRLQKRAEKENMQKVLQDDGISLRAFPLDDAGLKKTMAISTFIQRNAISENPEKEKLLLDLTIDKDLAVLKDIKSTSLESANEKHLILLATRDSDQKVVGYHEYHFGKHYTEDEIKESIMKMDRKTAILETSWVHDDYQGKQNALGKGQGKPYTLNMALLEAGMQVA
jgi:hypothetical protein